MAETRKVLLKCNRGGKKAESLIDLDAKTADALVARGDAEEVSDKTESNGEVEALNTTIADLQKQIEADKTESNGEAKKLKAEIASLKKENTELKKGK